MSAGYVSASLTVVRCTARLRELATSVPRILSSRELVAMHSQPAFAVFTTLPTSSQGLVHLSTSSSKIHADLNVDEEIVWKHSCSG